MQWFQSVLRRLQINHRVLPPHTSSVRVRVTEADEIGSTVWSSKNCPVARALHRIYPDSEFISVGAHFASVRIGPHKYLHLRFPPYVADRIVMFMQGPETPTVARIAPFEFDAEVIHETIAR